MKKYLDIIKKHGFNTDEICKFNSNLCKESAIYYDSNLVYKFGFTKEEISKSEKQNYLLSLLKNNIKTVKITNVKYFYKCEKYSLLIYEKISGNVISWDEYKNFEISEKIKFSNHLTDIILELHDSLNSNNIKKSFNFKKDWKTEILFTKYLIKKINSKSLTFNEKQICLNSVNDCLDIFSRIDKDKNSLIIHNDLHIRNIIFNDKKITGLIDFDNSEYSKSYFDFRYFYFHDRFSANIMIEKYSRQKNIIFEEDKLYASGLLIGLSGIVFKKNYQKSFDLLNQYFKERGQKSLNFQHEC